MNLEHVVLPSPTTMLMEQAAAAGLAWSAQVDVPWFLAGAMGVGVPAGIAAGSVVAENGHVLFLVSFMSSLSVRICLFTK